MTPKQRLVPELTSIDIHYLASILQHRLLPLAVISPEVSFVCVCVILALRVFLEEKTM